MTVETFAAWDQGEWDRRLIAASKRGEVDAELAEYAHAMRLHVMRHQPESLMRAVDAPLNTDDVDAVELLIATAVEAMQRGDAIPGEIAEYVGRLAQQGFDRRARRGTASRVIGIAQRQTIFLCVHVRMREGYSLEDAARLANRELGLGYRDDADPRAVINYYREIRAQREPHAVFGRRRVTGGFLISGLNFDYPPVTLRLS